MSEICNSTHQNRPGGVTSKPANGRYPGTRKVVLRHCCRIKLISVPPKPARADFVDLGGAPLPHRKTEAEARAAVKDAERGTSGAPRRGLCSLTARPSGGHRDAYLVFLVESHFPLEARKKSRSEALCRIFSRPPMVRFMAFPPRWLLPATWSASSAARI
jgi:hypothetical protein